MTLHEIVTILPVLADGPHPFCTYPAHVANHMLVDTIPYTTRHEDPMAACCSAGLRFREFHMHLRLRRLSPAATESGHEVPPTVACLRPHLTFHSTGNGVEEPFQILPRTVVRLSADACGHWYSASRAVRLAYS